LAQGTAQAQVNLITGQNDALVIKLRGEAQAKAIDAQVQALKANPDYVKYVTATRWDGALPRWTGGGPLPLLNLGVADAPVK